MTTVGFGAGLGDGDADGDVFGGGDGLCVTV
jgi:hypothetical protein